MPSRTVVIGAGAAGLGVAAELAERAVACTVLEQADQVGAAWSGRYESLRLHTARWLSGAPGARIPRALGPWVSRDDFVGYLRQYAGRRGISPEFGVAARRVERRDGRWRIETSKGAVDAETVVVATGYCRQPRMPEWPGIAEFPGSIMHSSAYRSPEPYLGQHVLVVGAGNSAAEIAVEMVGVAARVTLSVRTPPNIVRRSVAGVPSQLFGIVLGRAPEALVNPLVGALRRVAVPDLSGEGLPAPAQGFSQFLRTRTVPILDHGFVDAVRSGSIGVAADVDMLDADGVVLVDGSRLHPDALICATGFHPALEPMVGHLDVLDQRGIPRVSGPRTLAHAPGLYFVGIAVTLGGLLREIAGEARSVAEAIAKSSASGD